MLYYSPSKGPKHRWHKDSCGLEQQKITKTASPPSEVNPGIGNLNPSKKRRVNPPSPRRRMPSWKVYPNQNSSWKLLKSLEMTSCFLCISDSFDVYALYPCIEKNDQWPLKPPIHQSGWLGCFFWPPKKNGLRPSGYGTCMRAAGRLEDWPCAIFLLQEMQVRIHGWQASRLRCYKDGAKTKKYDVRSSYELQIIPTVSQCLIWIALDLKR